MNIKYSNKESGQTLVEFALVLPLLLLVIFGTIEFGRLMHAHIMVNSAAREGVRKAAVTGNVTDIETAIRNDVITFATTVEQRSYADITNTSLYPDSSAKVWYAVHYPSGRYVDKEVEVYVKGRVDIFTPIINSILGSPRPTPSGGAKAVMQIEN